MPDWSVGMALVGLWACAFYLEKMARSAAKVEKEIVGLRYQMERLQERGSKLSNDLHDIKINTYKTRADGGSAWTSARWEDD